MDRFQVTPAYKRADRYDSRNESGRVRDGFILTDTLTGAVKRLDLKRETAREIERALDREATIDWNRVACWDVWLGGSRRPNNEVSGYDETGERIGMLALITSVDADETEKVVRRWLNAVGGPADLPQREDHLAARLASEEKRILEVATPGNRSRPSSLADRVSAV